MGQPDQIERPIDAVASWCLGCDYPLNGLTENRCPECGREFNPRDPKTMRTPQTPGRVAQWIMRPPGRRSFWISISGSLITLAFGVAPGGYAGFGPVLLFWMLLLPAWGIRLFLWVVTCLLANNGRGLQIDRRAAQWLVIPGAFVLSMLLLITWIPLRIGFLVSHSAIESLAADTIAATNNLPLSKWVGIYRAEKIKKTNWGMYFTVSGTGPMQVGGFAYSPGGPPDFNSGEIAAFPIGGKWYAWYEDW